MMQMTTLQMQTMGNNADNDNAATDIHTAMQTTDDDADDYAAMQTMDNNADEDALTQMMDNNTDNDNAATDNRQRCR